jgi:hypothetical protein
MKIGIAIPCQKHQIQNIQKCLDSIEAQKEKPDYVVLSVSGCEQQDIPQYKYTFPLKVLTFRKEFNQAENRNIAASLCKYEQCTHISFFDTESEMHPQRIHCISIILKTTPFDILLHSYADAKDKLESYSGLNVVKNKLQRSKTGCAIVEGNIGARIHHSHCTVKTDIWHRIRFHEEKEYEQKDNAIFCGDVLAEKDVQSIYIREALS